MNNRHRISLPHRAPLSAAIAAVTLALAGPGVMAEETTSGAMNDQTQAEQSGQRENMDESQSWARNSAEDIRGDAAEEADTGWEAGEGTSATASAAGEESMEDTEEMAGQTAGTDDAGQAGQSSNAQAVAQLADQEESLKTFTEALKQSGIADALTDQTNYTLFAPTNDAFESASGKSAEELMKPENRKELISLLRAHIVADDVDMEMARRIPEARTIDGGTVKLTSEEDKLQIGDASLVQDPIQQGTLRVYPIDAVLEPQAGAQMAASGDTGTSGQAGASQQDQQDQMAQAGAGAGGQSAASEAEFDELDQNGDGYLSQEELQEADGIAAADTAADDMDSDGDGQVSRSEFAVFEQTPTEDASGAGESGQSGGSESAGGRADYNWESSAGDQQETPQ